jgi:hypothetical protein
MRRTIAFLFLLSASVFWSGCTTTNNSNTTGNANTSNANVHANMNANEHGNMNAGDHGNMDMGKKNANANQKP